MQYDVGQVRCDFSLADGNTGRYDLRIYCKADVKKRLLKQPLYYIYAALWSFDPECLVGCLLQVHPEAGRISDGDAADSGT